MCIVTDQINLSFLQEFKEKLPNMHGDVDLFYNHKENSTDEIKLCLFYAKFYNSALRGLPKCIKYKFDQSIEFGGPKTEKNYLICVARIQKKDVLLKTFFNQDIPYIVNYHRIFSCPKKFENLDWNFFFFYEIGKSFPPTSGMLRYSEDKNHDILEISTQEETRTIAN